MVAEVMVKGRMEGNRQKIENKIFVLEINKLAQTVAREPFFKFDCFALSRRQQPFKT
jgi:hypothetical protein